MKVVPSYNQCKERLIKLLESVNGDVEHQAVADFWASRAKWIHQTDEPGEVVARAATYSLLQDAWDELLTPPAAPVIDEEDAFGAFGL
ncbi:MAG: hypothetical protein JST01_14415 [Cyanobacteria bacterium SZAS TMP-1]|nr:hypothetical protein [Cyanobacteria bacterium SZAS TMP-1]